MPEYYELIARLRVLCDNHSELSGKMSDWKSDFLVEPHHINGRSGTRLANPFEVIMLTRDEHEAIHNHQTAYTKEDLYRIVLPLRIAKGFKQGKEDTNEVR